MEKKAGASFGNKETPDTGSETSTAWRYKRPENGEPNTKVLNYTTYTFCKKCGRWNSGGRRNSSDDNKTEEEIIKLKYSAGNVAATHDDNPPGGRILYLMGSLFWGSVQKTAGTEVVDNRDSNSYSGAEYSWSPTEKMYGEDIFGSQVVWSDNEDGMSLGNKPCDVMGLDAVYDNIISDEFSDDDE